MQTISPMKRWMALATVDEQEQVAQAAGTSRGHLYQLAGGYRSASADLGRKIEHATKALARAKRGELPVVYRTDTVPACRQCEYAQKCLGSIAVASEFPIHKDQP